MLRTTARRDGGVYVISGTKWFITGADGANYAIVMARIEDGSATMFLTDMDRPGITLERNMDSLDRCFTGGHGVLRFDDVRIPAEDVLGEVGKGSHFEPEHLMLNNTTVSHLRSLKLHGFAEALQQQQEQANCLGLSFDERLGHRKHRCQHPHDLLEIIDDRVGQRATIITHQLPIEHWHAWLGDPTIADAILDRLMQHCRRFNLEGESRRTRQASARAAGKQQKTVQEAQNVT